MENTKKWYQSKMVWFNVLSTISAFAIVLTDVIPEGYGYLAVAAVGIVNAILRIWFTDTALTA